MEKYEDWQDHQVAVIGQRVEVGFIKKLVSIIVWDLLTLGFSKLPDVKVTNITKFQDCVRGYASDKLFTTFIVAFPIDHPR